MRTGDERTSRRRRLGGNSKVDDQATAHITATATRVVRLRRVVAPRDGRLGSSSSSLLSSGTGMIISVGPSVGASTVVGWREEGVW
jgi:hypothetical protein